jgi:hypothetical protein
MTMRKLLRNLLVSFALANLASADPITTISYSTGLFAGETGIVTASVNTTQTLPTPTVNISPIKLMNQGTGTVTVSGSIFNTSGVVTTMTVPTGSGVWFVPDGGYWNAISDSLSSGNVPGGPAGGVLSGTYPNPGFANIGAYTLLANSTNASAAPTAVSTAIILGTPGYTDTAGTIGIQQTGSINNYYQWSLQNQSAGTTASADFIAGNDLETSTTYYADFGRNSSGFTGTGNFNAANAGYLYNSNGDLSIGTVTANAIHFIVGGISNADSFSITSAGVVTDNSNNLTMSGGSTWNDASGQLTLAAGGSNQNVVLTPSGSGIVISSAKLQAPGVQNVVGTTLTIDSLTHTAAMTGVTVSGTYTGAAVAQIGTAITNTVNQTSTAAFTDLLVNRTNTAPGSGTQRLLDLQVGSSSQFRVDTSGNQTFTSESFGGNGTAANPTYAWTNAGSTGLYWANPGIGFSVAGASVGTWTANTLTANNGLNVGGTAYSYGALPSGATTAGPVITTPATTYTVTGTNTATAFQGTYYGAPTITDASAGTVTDLFNEVWAGPAAGAGSLTVTRAHTLGVFDSTSATASNVGAFIVGNSAGSATSVAIGAGNVYANGTVTANGLQIFGNGTVTNNLSVGGTSYSYGALPSGTPTSGPAINTPAATYTVTGTNTATWFAANTNFVPTFTDASAGTITDAFIDAISGPVAAAGGSLTITRRHSLGILDATSASSSITGGLVIATTYGTAGTSIGLGGGNGNFGGSLIAGSTIASGTTITAGSTLATAAGVTNAAGAWNLGALRTSTALTASTTSVIQIAVGGVLYSLMVCSTNP